MPLLVALDEYEAAMRAVSIHAQLGLATGSFGHADVALRAILVICEEASNSVAQALSHPDTVRQVFTIEGGFEGQGRGLR